MFEPLFELAAITAAIIVAAAPMTATIIVCHLLRRLMNEVPRTMGVVSIKVH
jgi:hypothetical protein